MNKKKICGNINLIIKGNKDDNREVDLEGKKV